MGGMKNIIQLAVSVLHPGFVRGEKVLLAVGWSHLILRKPGLSAPRSPVSKQDTAHRPFIQPHACEGLFEIVDPRKLSLRTAAPAQGDL